MVVVQAQLSSFVKTIFRLWVMVGLLALVGANQLVAAPPIIQLSPGETTFVEPEGSDTITVAVDPGVTLSDPDNTTFTSVTVTISANYSYLHDWLSIDVPVHLEGVFTATFDSATGVLTIAPKGAPPPIAQWQEVLRLLIFSNTHNTPVIAPRTLTYHVSDGAETSTANKTLRVVATNDPPIIAAPASFAFTEDTAAALTGISFSDPDADSGALTVTFSVPSGALSATSGGGVTVGGTASALTLNGTLANLNAFIAANGLTYTPAADVAGNVTLTVTANDNGHSGEGGAKSASTTATLAIAAVNDAPVITVPGPQETWLGEPLVFSAANNNRVAIADVDAGSSPLLVTLSVSLTGASLSLSTTSGLTFTVGDGTDDQLMSFSGTLDDINAALDGLRFTPGIQLPAVLEIFANDQGATGLGGALSDVNIVPVTVNAPRPKVLSVSSPTADGPKKIGDEIRVWVNFDMPVIVDTTGGTPSLTLETGGVDRSATFVLGMASQVEFTYTVQEGDVSADLDYVSTSALALNGASMSSGISPANLTLPAPGTPQSLAGQKALVIDGIRPTATLTVSPTDALGSGQTATVTIVFSEPVSGFDLDDLSAQNATLSSLTTSDSITWTATLTPAADVSAPTNVVTLTASGVQDAAGNAGSGTPTSNSYAIDTQAPPAPSTPTTAENPTANVRPVFTGTAEAGATVTLYDGATVIGTVTAVGGNWSITPSADLAQGTHSLTATATDAAGNVSPASAALSLYIGSAPAISAILPAAGSPTGGNSVIIEGSDFADVSKVSFGSVDASFTAYGNDRIVAIAPAQAAGAVDITVTTPAGISQVNTTSRYTYADEFQQLVVNGSFENGLESWTAVAGDTTGSTGSASFVAVTAPGTEPLTNEPGFAATDGTHLALAGVSNTSGPRYSSVLYQDVAIPVGARSATISAAFALRHLGGLSAENVELRYGLFPSTGVPSVGGLTIVPSYIPTSADSALRLDAAQIMDVSALGGTTMRLGILVTSTSSTGAAMAGVDNVRLDVHMTQPVTFVTQPQNVSVASGSAAEFSVSVSGTGPFTYQWQRSADGTTFTDLDGQTSTTLAIASATTADIGWYRVVAQNALGSVASNAASLAVGVTYPAPAADGFASATTGGGSAAVATVLDAASFRTLAESDAAAVITIAGIINLDTPVNVKSNKTIQGLDAGATLVGNLRLGASTTNVVIRGLNITNPGTNIAGDAYTDGGDGVTIDGARDVLITHCSFFNCADHALRISNGADRITVSWNEFDYTNAQTVHRYSVLIGNDTATATTPRVTLHHNRWSTGVTHRMPYIVNAQVHAFGNLLDASGNTDGTDVRDGGQLLSERNVYTGINNPLLRSGTGRVRTIDNVYTATTGTTANAGTDTVFLPSYSYVLPAAANVTGDVTAGAGNTAGGNITAPTARSASISGTATVTRGSAFTLTANVTGATATSYQWRRNHTVITGATSATFTVQSAADSDAADYTVVAVLASGEGVVSTPFKLTVNQPPAPPPAQPSGGGGGGGGSPSLGYLGALLLLVAMRALQRRR